MYAEEVCIEIGICGNNLFEMIPFGGGRLIVGIAHSIEFSQFSVGTKKQE